MSKKPIRVSRGLKEYHKCCYSCIFSIMGAHNCTCKKTKETIHNMYGFVCSSWRDAELIECEICHLFVRSLGGHVRKHKLTASQYKEKFGYNRGTALMSKATKKQLKQVGNNNKENFKKINYVAHGGKPWEYQEDGYKLRTEGVMNQTRAKQFISKETRAKMSKATKNRKWSGNKGLVKSKEWRKKLSESLKRRFKEDVRRTIIRDSRGRIISYTDECRGYQVSRRYKKDPRRSAIYEL